MSGPASSSRPIARLAASLVAVIAVAVIAWLAFPAERGSDAIDPAALTRAAEQRESAGTSASGDDPVAARVDAFVRRCRDAVRSKVWPGRVVGFDGGVAAGALPYVTPRVDGLPVIRVAPRTNSDSEAPIAMPAAGRFGVSGSVYYTAWFGDSTASRHYFCELDASPTSIDVDAVSIEIVR